MAHDRNETLAKAIRKMSAVELAGFRANKTDNSVPAILAERELERRTRIHQHELDLDLLFKQGRWMKWSTLATVGATLIGAIAGAMLTYWLQSNPQPKQPESPPRPAQQQSGKPA